MNNIALIVAAGRGHRFHSNIPKQYLKIQGLSPLERSINIFTKIVDAIQVVIHQDDLSYYQEISEKYQLLPVVYGGETRQESVRIGLEHLISINPKNVLIHDAVRPYITVKMIKCLIDQLKIQKAVIIGHPATDTIKYIEGEKVVETLSRNKLYHIQTPQAFDYQTILAAHRQNLTDVTDDATLVEKLGVTVKFLEHDSSNNKITYLHDIKISYETRVGIGFDVHKLIPAINSHIIIGGIKISHDHFVEAHSDGDVVFHALTDAILGALGKGDIGAHFPPEDDQWKNADSSVFVKYANDLAKENNARIINIDVIIITEKPKILPYKDLMKNNIANILNIEISRINIKATTTEKLGFIGRNEGIASQVVVSVEKEYNSNKSI